MHYSYSQISQYLTCPRRYRRRYLDGWQEKEQRASAPRRKRGCGLATCPGRAGGKR